ncbi:MAG: hypothetical protein NVS3B1_12800 [Marmoricola sp.]
MHGGVKFYRGNPAAARNYVEADHSRADDYYLAEGTGLAERLVATVNSAGTVEVTAGGSLDGDAYQSWVAGYTPEGRPKGRLRKDDQALRFVEVVVNGPKTWSLAASVDPEISAAYDAAQSRAATEIVAWLAAHSTTRVGPRGLQVQVPVDEIEAAVVRHYTSRAGDPHRHLHLQINARVFAAGKWRGLHTAGTRDQIEAINGIGHAAIACDPEFRAALTRRGYTLDPATSEIRELGPFAARFSARASQIARNVERFEAQWRAENPDKEPGPALWRAWDRRAWASARPDKVVPADGADLVARWREELTDLGFRPPVLRAELGRPVWIRHDAQPVVQPGGIDRDGIAATVVAVLGRAHSAWNPADIRGEVERRLAALNLIADPTARRSLAEDVTARAIKLCVPLLPGRVDVPEHVRSLTSKRVLAVERELVARLEKRAEPKFDYWVQLPHPQIASQLDGDELPVVAALVGCADMVIVEGPAGSGKTRTLRATAASNAMTGRNRGFVVVAPTMKAAKVAETQIGAEASSAARLIHAHGYRWDDTNGGWWREDVDRYSIPEHYRLGSGDYLVIDEAGMLDQDTTLALLTIADEAHAKVAFLGDRHQLPAVGRGGALDHAIAASPPSNVVGLATVRRFADPDYADLTLQMREGRDLEDLFDQLHHTGHIQIHASEPERTTALVNAALAGEAVIADSREHVATLNAHLHDHNEDHNQDHNQGPATANATTSSRTDRQTFTTDRGETLAVGDQVATRRNEPRLGVANRDRWHITHINTAEHAITVKGARGTRVLPAGYAAQHLELAYATTVHGAQGETVDRAHYALDETSRAAAVYVAMTRGRLDNTAHLVAENLDQARAQWRNAMSRGAVDLGSTHARNLALEDIDRYGPMSQALLHQELDHRAALRETQRSQRHTSSYSQDHTPSPSHPDYGPSI